MPKHDDYLQSPFYGRAFMACSWDHAMGEFCVNCKDIELAISAAVAEAVAAELEARPNLLQEDEIVTIVNRKVAEDWAQFSDGKPPKVLAPQVRHIIAAWAAIRARDGGETSNTD